MRGGSVRGIGLVGFGWVTMPIVGAVTPLAMHLFENSCLHDQRLTTNRIGEWLSLLCRRFRLWVLHNLPCLIVFETRWGTVARVHHLRSPHDEPKGSVGFDYWPNRLRNVSSKCACSSGLIAS